MRLLLTLTAGIALAMAAIWFLPQLQGYVLIRTGGYAVETSVLVLLLVVLGSVALIHFAVWLWNLPGNVLRGWLERRAHAQLELGMLALSEGDWSRAEKALRLSAKNSSRPAAQYLAAARAAHRSGKSDPERIENYLTKANETTRAEHPIAVTRAQLLLAAGEAEDALEVLEAVRKPHETRPKVLELLARAYERLGRWDELADLVPELVKQGLIDEEAGRRIERTALETRLNRAGDLGELQRIWSSVPRRKHHADLLAIYAENAIKFGHGATVEKEIRTQLGRAWSDRLVQVYGLLGDESAPARLKHAEKWLADQPDSAFLHLTLARLCVACRLWGKAREHFETSLALQPMPETHRELGDLYAQEGDPASALVSYRRALDRIEGREGEALPKPSPANQGDQGRADDAASD